MSAEEHRAAAIQALKDVDDCPESPGEQRVLTQAAIAHALLGLLEIQMGRTDADDLIDCVRAGQMTLEQADEALHSETQPTERN